MSGTRCLDCVKAQASYCDTCAAAVLAERQEQAGPKPAWVDVPPLDPQAFGLNPTYPDIPA